METKKSLLPADFEYAEFSGDLLCPFCNALLHKIPPEIPDNPTEDDVVELGKHLDGSALFCRFIVIFTVIFYQPKLISNLPQ